MWLLCVFLFFLTFFVCWTHSTVIITCGSSPAVLCLITARCSQSSAGVNYSGVSDITGFPATLYCPRVDQWDRRELQCEGTINTRWFHGVTNSPTALNVPPHLMKTGADRRPVLVWQGVDRHDRDAARRTRNKRRRERELQLRTHMHTHTGTHTHILVFVFREFFRNT